MKKTFTSGFLGLVISGLLLSACSQVATYESEDLTLEQAKADKGGFTLSPYAASSDLNLREYSEDACTTSCITQDSESWFVKSYEHIYDDQDPVKKIKVDIYNTPTQLIYDFYTENTTIKYLKIGDTFLINNVASTSYQHVVELGDFGSDWDACDQYDATIFAYRNNLSGVGGGQLAKIVTSYNLVPVCQGCGEESFSYEESIGETDVDVVFSYNYSEVAEISIDFTFPQIKIDIPNGESYIGADGKIYTVTGNGTVFHWSGKVSCSSENPTTFAFEGLIPDCGPSTAKDGLAQIWTNAKVVAIKGVPLVDDPETLDIDEGPYSLKGNLNNIVYSGCQITK